MHYFFFQGVVTEMETPGHMFIGFSECDTISTTVFFSILDILTCLLFINTWEIRRAYLSYLRFKYQWILLKTLFLLKWIHIFRLFSCDLRCILILIKYTHIYIYKYLKEFIWVWTWSTQNKMQYDILEISERHARITSAQKKTEIN
jgi:hypothetical protein